MAPSVDEMKAVAEMTARIVSSYVGRNHVSADGLAPLIKSVHDALRSAGGSTSTTLEVPSEPAVSIKKSITPDYLICLEDGKHFRSLKRHLWTHYNLTPEAYRAKWGLAPDYPMVAPNYAKTRSQLAKQMGLGQRRSSSRRRRAP